jgi:outer membrane immunogenic protein
MKQVFAIVSALLLAASAAQAADMALPPPLVPPPPPFTGWYVGANLGWGWTHGGNGESCINSNTGTSAGCAIVPDTGLNASGFLGGGQIGYNWQANSFVFGVEADIQGADIHKSNLITTPGFTYTTSEKLDWFGTVRPRLGVLATQTFLFYVTGGLIYGEVKTSQNLFFPGSGLGWLASTSTTRTGGTVGGGIEWMFAPGWSAKVEGLWYNLGNVTTAAHNAVQTNFTDFKTFDLEGAMVRGGINYHFN